MMIPDTTARDVLRAVIRLAAHTCITWGCCLSSVAQTLERAPDDDELPLPRVRPLRAQA